MSAAETPASRAPGLLVGVLIASDRAARGERADATFALLEQRLAEAGHRCLPSVVVVDEIEPIRAAIQDLSTRCAVVLTSGGTGIGPRDVTVEATLGLLDRQLPGIAEAMRSRSRDSTPMAMLSRATAGTVGRALVVNLPGSPRGAVECLEVVLPVLRHAHELLGEGHSDCSTTRNEA